MPSQLWRWVRRAVGLIFVILLVAPLVLVGAIYYQARDSKARSVDAIVVMGAAQFNGTPSQVFQARLDTALSLYRQGLSPLIVVTGGRLAGDQFTEAESGRKFLIDRGVPADAVLMESVSHNTSESFRGVARLLGPRDAESILIVSDGFHLLRSKLLARDEGFKAYGYAAENSPIEPGSVTELRYVIREAIAVSAHVLHVKP